MVGVLGMIVAMVLYSIGVWGAYRSKKFSQRNVMFILGGVVFDVIGTGGMFVTAGNRFLFDTPSNIVHTTAALVAFFGMLAVGIVGTWAVQKNKDELLATLSRWALAPWTLWAVIFVWGMLQRPKA
jgi:uncharacterized repeat protein (TIGR03987 family)